MDSVLGIGDTVVKRSQSHVSEAHPCTHPHTFTTHAQAYSNVHTQIQMYYVHVHMYMYRCTMYMYNTWTCIYSQMQGNRHEEPQSGAENQTLLELEGFNSSDGFSYSSSQPGKATTLHFQEDHQKIEVWSEIIFAILSELVDQEKTKYGRFKSISSCLSTPGKASRGRLLVVGLFPWELLFLGPNFLRSEESSPRDTGWADVGNVWCGLILITFWLTLQLFGLGSGGEDRGNIRQVQSGVRNHTGDFNRKVNITNYMVKNWEDKENTLGYPKVASMGNSYPLQGSRNRGKRFFFEL